MRKREGLDVEKAVETLNWYEASLPLQERKLRGHFSTPPQLVERILDACGYTPENDLTHLRVLDPACGSGNFLAGAARRLVSFAARRKLSSDALTALVARNLWGFDPDPVSCFLAEMQVRTALDGNVGGQFIDGNVGGQFIAPVAEMQGEQYAIDDASPTSDSRSSCGLPLHIHQADGLALPWEHYEGVDLFLANPPYLAAKNTDLSGYRSTHQRGQLDSYLLFLDVALSIVRPHGWLGLVLPDPVLARANAAKARARLLETCTIHHLWHLSGVFAAQVGAVVLIAQKCPPKSTHLVSWERTYWRDKPRESPEQQAQQEQPEEREQTTYTLPQSLFQRQPGAELRYLLSGSHGGSLAECLRTHLEHTTGPERRLAPLSDFLTIHRGEELGRKSPLLVWDDPLHALPIPIATPPNRPRATARVARTMIRTAGATSCHGRGDPCGRPEEPLPVLLGGVDVKPYGTPRGSCWIARAAIEKPLERYLAPKLLVVKSTDRLQAALDVQGHVALQTLYLLHMRTRNTVYAGPDDVYFFLALLNSRLLREYVYVLHTAYKWVQPQIEQHVLARLPVPLVEREARQEIIERAKQLMAICSEARAVVELNQHWQGLYEEQERAICTLYASVLPEIDEFIRI